MSKNLNFCPLEREAKRQMIKDFWLSFIPIFKDFWEQTPVELVSDNIQYEGKVAANQISELNDKNSTLLIQNWTTFFVSSQKATYFKRKIDKIRIPIHIVFHPDD